jgi:elongation factor Ts
MTQISAAQVKELRERTGAGMMECKKALTEAQGDMEAAIEWLRKSGLAKAVKRSARTAAEGVIVIEQAADAKRAAMVEVNCETDFVAKGDDFRAFASGVARLVLAGRPADMAALMGTPMEADASVESRRQALIARIGENIDVRRFALIETDGVLGTYLHGTRIGVLVELAGGDTALARDIAMHVAASRPICISAEQVPAETMAKEREIASAKAVKEAAEKGKPSHVIPKMVEGALKKFLEEVTLLGQSFVKNPDITVGELLKENNAQVKRYERFEVGEGIEKKSGNFAEEVMAQVKGS